MTVFDFLPGTSIGNAAQAMVDSAPSRTTFNEIPLRARYATTLPRDIVAHYRRKCDERFWFYASKRIKA